MQRCLIMYVMHCSSTTATSLIFIVCITSYSYLSHQYHSVQLTTPTFPHRFHFQCILR
jgi:hypothetical protein